MTQDTPIALDLIEKIGSPLAAALFPVSGDEAQAEQAASVMAQLLDVTVSLSVRLYEGLGLSLEAAAADQARLKLAGLLAGHVGALYKEQKALPDEAAQKTILESFLAVKELSDQFTGAKTQEEPVPSYLESHAVLMAEITRNPFGQEPKALLGQITDRLSRDAKMLSGGETEERQAYHILTTIYAACYRDGQSLEGIVQDYEMRLAMAVALTDNTPPEKTTQPDTSQQKANPPAADEPAKPAVFGGGGAAGLNKSAEESSPPPAGGPMGFFAKKPPDETPPADPPPPAGEQPKPPEETPPPPAEEEKPEGNPGNPMSFFKTPPKTDGDEE